MADSKMPAPEHVSIARLPVTGRFLFGRDVELAQLDAAWADEDKRVISIVAMGGAGKTALVDRWLKRMAKDGYRGAERVYGWSFYSQGSSDSASGEAFISEALEWFGKKEPVPKSPWDRGAMLARLVKKHRTLLVLDGLEPLQAKPGADEGKIRDPGVGVLVRELAASGSGLCVISTRVAVEDLAAGEDAASPKIDLGHLAPEDGAELLKQLGVTGRDEELRDAAVEMKGHGLALTLLGTYLVDACAGDVRRRKEIGPLEGDARKGEHAKHVMGAYARWFGDGPEVAVLRLLGLFDRPADAGCIAALRTAPVITGLTESLVGMNEVRWNQTLAKLRRARLVGEASNEEPGTIDAHPLVREYFGERLREEASEAWRAGHGRLFDHLQKVAPDLPEDTVAMGPLYAAVVHGCRAERRQEALVEVFITRVCRGAGFFNTKQLGAFGAYRGMLAAFFAPPWTDVAPGLTEPQEAFVLGEASFALRALGRLDEAVEPMQRALAKRLTQEAWKNAAIAANNLSELHLARGAVGDAVAIARRGVELADRSGDQFQKMSKRAGLANAVLQTGELDEARVLFEEAEAWQKEDQPMYPRLYSLPGFLYCDLLLRQGWLEDVLARARQMLEWASAAEAPLLDFAFHHLTLGRAHLLAARDRTGDLGPARKELDQAVTGLRQAGQRQFLPLGLLARAELRLAATDPLAAEDDLNEALSIATTGGMLLHETDARLGFARLHLARGEHVQARASFERAKALVEKTGYHLRDPEVAELEAALAALPAPAPVQASNRIPSKKSVTLQTTMTKDQLLDALCELLPPQLDVLVEKLGIPSQYLSGPQTAVAARAVEILRYMKAQDRVVDVERALQSLRASPAHGSTTVDFVIITALEEERDAVLAKLPGHEKLDRDGAQAHTYYEATVATNRKDRASYRVIVTSLSRMGSIQAAIKAGAVIQRWSPLHVLMVGIAGGVVGEAALGDVMVASDVADYTVGKVRDQQGREVRWVSYPADSNLLDAASNFPTGWEDLLDHERPEAGKARRRIGVIASGGDVIASKEQIAIYVADWPKLIGVEMEGGGVAAGLHDDIARPRFLMIRGVSDLANGEDNAGMKKRWREHACDVAAAYAIGFLRDGPVKAQATRG